MGSNHEKFMIEQSRCGQSKSRMSARRNDNMSVVIDVCLDHLETLEKNRSFFRRVSFSWVLYSRDSILKRTVDFRRNDQRVTFLV